MPREEARMSTPPATIVNNASPDATRNFATSGSLASVLLWPQRFPAIHGSQIKINSHGQGNGRRIAALSLCLFTSGFVGWLGRAAPCDLH
ncbi:hypothetical protein J3B00_004566 [Pseudomonas sp. BP8]|nr:hypothetical protein [Pseudomonas sp. BP8]